MWSARPVAISTRLTQRFDLQHPIVLAPMAMASGARLATAVSAAGGLGLLGGGYGEASWLRRELAASADQRVGCGFITWSLARQPQLLDVALAHRPVALMLSFGDPTPFARQVTDSGVPLMCQVDSLDDARRAVDIGADVIVAQGTEGGGHGGARSTLPFVPAVVDMVADRRPETLVLAAGGIADGRGLAAVLALGADGALLGSRFWTSQEAVAPPKGQARVLDCDGDDTLRTAVYDRVRAMDWPARFTGRVLRNGFVERWHGRYEELGADLDTQQARVRHATEAEDYDEAQLIVGEAGGLIRDVPPAGELVRRISAEASAVLTRLTAS